MSSAASLAEARALDAADPLHRFRDEFVIDPGVVYFDGNSLGRLPRRTVDRLARVVGEEWGRGLVRSWGSWIELPTAVGDRLGRTILGAAPGQTLVGDSTTVNLFKLAHAAFGLRPGRGVVVTDADNFPTDRYVLSAVADSRGGQLRVVNRPGTARIDEDVCLVSFSLVDYRTAELADVEAITRAAHDAGALVLWDLSHAAGAMVLELDAWGADMAVGCTYKYLNAGPGAPAFVYVSARHHRQLEPVIPGWFGHADQFAMTAAYEPAAGISRLLAGTPDVGGIAAVDEGVSLFDEAGMAAVRAKSAALTQMVIDAVADVSEVQVKTPRSADARGSHVALGHPAAWQVCQAMIEHGVIPDFREPDIIRIGVAPLYLSFEETLRGIDLLREVIASRAYERYPAQRTRVT